MNKNKLLWSVVLILIAIISIPIVHAQFVPTGSRLFFILINAAIIAVVLFILQAFLIPGKADKEKTFVFIVIFIASLAIAFIFGQTGFIWKTGQLSRFFNIYVAVNAIIIGVLAYFILGFLDVGKKLVSPEGKKGYGILIFLGALMWAVGIQSSYGNLFIWQAYREIVDFFIGPKGVLNPFPPQYRLIVFAGAFFILSFFFNNYLITGATGANQRINYGLALIMAVNLAAADVGLATIIQISELIFFLFLAKGLGDTVPGKKWGSNWFLSLVLIGWASAAAFYGTENQGLLATIMGVPLVALGLLKGPGVQIGKIGVLSTATDMTLFGIELAVFIILTIVLSKLLGRMFGGTTT